MTYLVTITLACDEPTCSAIYPMGATNDRLSLFSVIRSARADGWQVPRRDLGREARCPDHHQKETSDEAALVVLRQMRPDQQGRGCRVPVRGPEALKDPADGR